MNLGMIGKTVNGMAVVSRTGRKSGHDHIWVFRCFCGAQFERTMHNVRKSQNPSCGCLSAPRHGQKRTRAYRSWEAMKRRCLNARDPKFPDYGGRGIKVCDSWAKFPAFLEDMGQPPPNTTLDRIDVNGDYSKENCRWASSITQANNRRDRKTVEYKGRHLTVAELARMTGTGYFQIYYHIRRHRRSAYEAVSRVLARVAEN